MMAFTDRLSHKVNEALLILLDRFNDRDLHKDDVLNDDLTVQDISTAA